MNPADLAAQLSKMLRVAGVPHCLIGGLAVAVHGHPRGTKDADFLIDSQDPADIITKSKNLGLTIRPEHADFAAEGLIVLCQGDQNDPVADLLVVERDAERRMIQRAEPTTIADTDVPVIRVEDLVALKLSAGRAQDDADAEALLLRRTDVDRGRFLASARQLGVEAKLQAFLDSE